MPITFCRYIRVNHRVVNIWVCNSLDWGGNCESRDGTATLIAQPVIKQIKHYNCEIILFLRGYTEIVSMKEIKYRNGENVYPN